MGNKRRKDKTHQIGDSMPGTVGDSKGTHHDDSDSPMANIHNRREGELMSHREVDEFLHPEKYEDTVNRETHPNDYGELGRPRTLKEKCAKRFGEYWSDDKKRDFLQNDTDLTSDDFGWDDFEEKSKDTNIEQEK